MVAQRLIVAIGRIERALSRLEKLPEPGRFNDTENLSNRHEQLKSATSAAIADIDRILAGEA